MGKPTQFVNLPTKIMNLDEVRSVLQHLESRRLHWSEGTHKRMHCWMNCVIFRLSCCCGLRGCEIRRLRLSDFVIDGSRPVVKVRKEITKGQRRARLVPLWWDQGTLNALTEYVLWKRRQTLDANAILLAADFDSFRKQSRQYMQRRKLMSRWERFMKAALGDGRGAQLGVHSGRHTFCSHAIISGRSLVEVRDAAGHSDAQTTNQYLHALQTGTELPDLFPEENEE